MLLRKLSTMSGVDVFAKDENTTWLHCPQKWQFDSQIVEKSLAGYLSKYASKGKGRLGRYSDSGLPWFSPSRWIGMSRNVVEWIREESCSIEIPVNRRNVQDFFQILEEIIHGCNRTIKRHRYRWKVASGNTAIFYLSVSSAEARSLVAYAIDELLSRVFEQHRPVSAIYRRAPGGYRIHKYESCWWFGGSFESFGSGVWERLLASPEGAPFETGSESPYGHWRSGIGSSSVGSLAAVLGSGVQLALELHLAQVKSPLCLFTEELSYSVV